MYKFSIIIVNNKKYKYIYIIHKALILVIYIEVYNIREYNTYNNTIIIY